MSELNTYLELMAKKQASDLFFITGAPPSIKLEGSIQPISSTPMAPGLVKKLAYTLLNEHQRNEFEKTLELNLAISRQNIGRFRVNIYVQRGEVSMVIRYIKTEVPELDALNLPEILKKVVMIKHGLIVVVGATGAGKSTTLAAMLNHRNANSSNHILTIEDPIEFVHKHKRCIVGQREIGMDTLSYANALREAMREAPDVIVIGESRDSETIEAAITYADTGHLCLTSLHAVNANQALERIINVFPPDHQNQILMDLSINLKAIVAQRLVEKRAGGRTVATEVMLNNTHISELIRKGQINDIKGIMEKGNSSGMHTFDQSLYDMQKAGIITTEEALKNADSPSNLEWRMNFGGDGKAAAAAGGGSLSTSKSPFGN